MSGAGQEHLAGSRGTEPAQSQPLAPTRIERLRQEAREQEQQQEEEKARKARETQAWVQLKEQELLQLQVGRVPGSGAGG